MPPAGRVAYMSDIARRFRIIASDFDSDFAYDFAYD